MESFDLPLVAPPGLMYLFDPLPVPIPQPVLDLIGWLVGLFL